MNQWKEIFDRIGEAAAWEMLAEEAAELSASAAKVGRILRGDNPTPKEYNKASVEAVEELTDVLNAVDVIDSGVARDFVGLAKSDKARKMTRWYRRLFGGDACAEIH